MARDDAQSIKRPYAFENCVFGADEVVGRWVVKNLGEPIHLSEAPTAVGLLRNNRIGAGAIFEINNASPHVVSVTVAVTDPKVFSRRTLGRWFWYPFQFLNCSQIITTYAASNKQARAFNRQIGMVSVARIPGAAYDGSDLIVNQMLRDECPWEWRRDHGDA